MYDMDVVEVTSQEITLRDPHGRKEVGISRNTGVGRLVWLNLPDSPPSQRPSSMWFECRPMGPAKF
jgi:hypothetical protein